MRDKYILYTKEDCHFCRLAIKYLTEKEYEYLLVDVSKSPEVLESLKKAYRWDTVPIVFSRETLTEKYVGGYEEIRTVGEMYRFVGGYDALISFISNKQKENGTE